MHTIKLHIEDKVFDKIMYFLKNLPKNEVRIVENGVIDDFSYLEQEIDVGLNSGLSNKSHEDIIKDIKQKYA
ncbi:hypothetical protein [Aliarcobacter cryaerophilus]|uniref:hypothetical protein n=1 Tax=Aliarcobacter cryaerophilus TaxID=28198 RepID=UPI003DA3DA1C